MTEHNIKVDVPGAQGAYGSAAADLAANRGGVAAPAAGLDPRLGTTLTGMSTTHNANVDGAAALNGQGSQFANGFDAADKDGAAKAGAAGPKGPGDPSNPAGAPKVPGADKFTSRLTPSDLAKLAQPYQSAMPAVQSLPQVAQSIPSMLNAPLQAAQAPIQSMLSGPGGASILDGLLSRGNSGNGFDGGPASLALGGSRPSGAADGRLYDVTKQVLGMPYAWGGGHGASPGPSQGISDGGGPADRAGDFNKVGLDCSGLSRYALWKAYGIDIGGTSQAQYASGTPVSNPVAGDLVFPKSSFGSDGPGHVQVYLGNGQVLEAPSSGQTVKISPLQGGSQFRRFVQAA
jgi:cell wall-associated NlpC family hydrolase